MMITSQHVMIQVKSYNMFKTYFNITRMYVNIIYIHSLIHKSLKSEISPTFAHAEKQHQNATHRLRDISVSNGTVTKEIPNNIIWKCFSDSREVY